MSAHELITPNDFLKKSVSDEGDNYQTTEDIALESQTGEVFERDDVEKDAVIVSTPIKQVPASPQSESADLDRSQNSLVEDRIAELLGLKPAKELPAPRLLPPSRFTFPLPVSTTELQSSNTPLSSVDKAINTDQIGEPYHCARYICLLPALFCNDNSRVKYLT